jgi:transcriptional regulator GlxA family with amidase domain
VAEILDLSRELTCAALERRLSSAAGFQMRSVLKNAFPGVLPSRTRALLETAGDVVARGGTALDLAARLNTGERTLNRWCNKMYLPEPRRLLAWLRILLAADMLSEGDRSVAAVARACGYASDSSLRNAFRMVAKTTPADVKTKGFRTTVAIPFARELSDIQEQPDTATRAKSFLN